MKLIYVFFSVIVKRIQVQWIGPARFNRADQTMFWVAGHNLPLVMVQVVRNFIKSSREIVLHPLTGKILSYLFIDRKKIDEGPNYLIDAFVCTGSFDRSCALVGKVFTFFRILLKFYGAINRLILFSLFC